MANGDCKLERAQLTLELAGAELLDAISGVAYLTDAGGVILAVGSGWRAFAQDSGAAQIVDESVVGRTVFECIDGDDVRASYQMLHDALAANPQRKITFPFRCDAPDTRRDMLMSMSAARSNGGDLLILYQSQMVSLESRPPISLFEPRRRHGKKADGAPEPVVVMCSYCQRVAWPGGVDTAGAEWIAPEAYYARGGTAQARVSHGVCPTCHDTLLSEIT